MVRMPVCWQRVHARTLPWMCAKDGTSMSMRNLRLGLGRDGTCLLHQAGRCGQDSHAGLGVLVAKRWQQRQQHALQPGLQQRWLHRPHHAAQYGAARLPRFCKGQSSTRGPPPGGACIGLCPCYLLLLTQPLGCNGPQV